MKPKTSWKTSLGGILLSIGTLVAASQDEKTHAIGAGVAAVGSIILGLAARDNGVTSEQAGAK